MRLALAGLTMMLATGASAATVYGSRTLDFEDVALGSYESLTLQDVTFTAGMGQTFEIVQGDPTGATGNVSQVLSVTGGQSLRIDVGSQMFEGYTPYLPISFAPDDPSTGVLRVGFEELPDPSNGAFLSTPNAAGFDIVSAYNMQGYMTIGWSVGSGSFALDDVVIGPAEVPVPASLGLLGVALAGLGLARRRKP